MEKQSSIMKNKNNRHPTRSLNSKRVTGEISRNKLKTCELNVVSFILFIIVILLT